MTGRQALAGPAPGWRSVAAPAALGAVALLVLAAAAGAAGVGPARVAVLLLVAPLAEEALFRAGLHEALLRRAWSPALANGATALAFGLAHGLLRGDALAVAVALPALCIGLLYGRTRRLLPCVALHALMNAAWLAWQLAVVLPATGR